MDSIAKDLADIKMLPRIALPERKWYLVIPPGGRSLWLHLCHSFKFKLMLSDQPPRRGGDAWMS